MKKESVVDVKTIVATAIGGIMLLLATIFLTSFVSAPPTRAEFDSLKTQLLTSQKNIDRKLTDIENKQDSILSYLLNQKGK